MKLFLIIGAKRVKLRAPYPEADHAIAELSCPVCGVAPLKVGGTDKRFSDDDRAIEATAICYACDRLVGVIRAEPNTLFGVREDARVARMGVRIY